MVISLGRWGLLAGIVWGASNVFLINAVQQTYVGNVLVILASAPMFAAICSYLIHRQLLPWRTIITCVVSFGVLALVFLGSTSSSGSSTGGGGNTIVGNMLAVLASSTYGLYFSLLNFIAVTDG